MFECTRCPKTTCHGCDNAQKYQLTGVAKKVADEVMDLVMPVPTQATSKLRSVMKEMRECAIRKNGFSEFSETELCSVLCRCRAYYN